MILWSTHNIDLNPDAVAFGMLGAIAIVAIIALVVNWLVK